MFNIKNDIQSLTVFKRNTSELIKQLKSNGHPIVLTVNGKAEIVVQDAEAYQETLDRLENIEAVRLGLEQMKASKTFSANQVDAKLRKKYAIPN